MPGENRHHRAHRREDDLDSPNAQRRKQDAGAVRIGGDRLTHGENDAEENSVHDENAHERRRQLLPEDRGARNRFRQQEVLTVIGFLTSENPQTPQRPENRGDDGDPQVREAEEATEGEDVAAQTEGRGKLRREPRKHFLDLGASVVVQRKHAVEEKEGDHRLGERSSEEAAPRTAEFKRKYVHRAMPPHRPCSNA